MLALLKLIPLKDWIYAGIIAALLGLFGWYTVHERNIGKADVVAVDNKAAAKQVAHNVVVESTALETINVIAQKYSASIASPIADSPHVIVRYVTRPAGAVPAAAGSACSAPSTADVSATDTTDIGPGLDTAGRDADAEVIALQAIIRADRVEYGIAP